MAKIENAHLCEHAYLDACDRLCMMGMTTHLPVPFLPLAVNRIMIAARLLDARRGEELELGIFVRAPDGLCEQPDCNEGCEIEIAGEYLLITLRNVPLREEGVYKFCIALGDAEPATIDVPVLLATAPAGRLN